MNKKIIALILSIIICITACTVGLSMYAASGTENNETDKTEKPEETTLPATQTVGADKTETVYVIAGADGSAEKVIVTDWIKNFSSASSIADKTDLENIESVKGDCSYTLSGDEKIWDSESGDVYYKGTTDKTLPVDVKLTYTLDGKAVTADEIAGKSGHVTLRFDFTNNQYETVEIDGVNEKIYVPFAVLSGLILDNDKFSNVEVTNGKLINDGSRYIAVGCAFPGAQESTGLSEEEFDIPDYIEISADTTDFALPATMTIVTNEIWNGVDTTKLNDMGSLKEQLSELDAGTLSLVDGTSQLYIGIKELSEKLPDIISAINEGIEQLSDGAGTISANMKLLTSGLSELQSGLGQLSSNSATLNAGAKQIFETLLAAADSSLADSGLTVPKLTTDNYSDTLSGVIASISEENVRAEANAKALEAVTAEVEANKEAILTKVKAGYRDQILEGVLKAAGMNYSAAQYDGAVAAGYVDSATQQKINAAVETQVEKLTEEQMQKLIDENMKSNEVTTQIEAAVEKVAAGKAQLETLKAQLDSYMEFYTGLAQYTAGVDSAYAGSKKLYSGSQALSEGTDELKTGIDEFGEQTSALSEGDSSLTAGVAKLEDGAQEIADGTKKLYDEGISKLSELVDSDLENLAVRIQAMLDVSSDYNTFGGISADMSGIVRFIYRTAAVGD